MILPLASLLHAGACHDSPKAFLYPKGKTLLLQEIEWFGKVTGAEFTAGSWPVGAINKPGSEQYNSSKYSLNPEEPKDGKVFAPDYTVYPAGQCDAGAHKSIGEPHLSQTRRVTASKLRSALAALFTQLCVH
jgi:hypothetical protein